MYFFYRRWKFGCEPSSTWWPFCAPASFDLSPYGTAVKIEIYHCFVSLKCTVLSFMGEIEPAQNGVKIYFLLHLIKLMFLERHGGEGWTRNYTTDTVSYTSCRNHWFTFPPIMTWGIRQKRQCTRMCHAIILKSSFLPLMNTSCTGKNRSDFECSPFGSIA